MPSSSVPCKYLLNENHNPSSSEQFSESDFLAYGKKRWRRGIYLSVQFCVLLKLGNWNQHQKFFTFLICNRYSIQTDWPSVAPVSLVQMEVKIDYFLVIPTIKMRSYVGVCKSNMDDFQWFFGLDFSTYASYWYYLAVEFSVSEYQILDFSHFYFSSLVIFVTSSTQFSMNFHNNSKNKSRKIYFSIISTHCASSIKTGSKLRGGGAEGSAYP